MKIKLSILITVAGLVLLSWHLAITQDLKRRLATSPSEEAIFEFAKEFEKAGHGKVESCKFSNQGREILILWTSGGFIFGYYFDGNKWVMFLDDLFDPNTLVIKFSSPPSGNQVSYRSLVKERGELAVNLKDLRPLYKIHK
jgi:hypothetical protein